MVLEDLVAMLIFVTLLRSFINRDPVRCRSVECLAIGVLRMLLTGVRAHCSRPAGISAVEHVEDLPGAGVD